MRKLQAADRWLTSGSGYALWLGLALALIAASVGALLGFAGVSLTAAVLLALATALWTLTSLEVGLWGVIAVITLLPFAALPVRIVFKPTFLDLIGPKHLDMGFLQCVWIWRRL